MANQILLKFHIQLHPDYGHLEITKRMILIVEFSLKWLLTYRALRRARVKIQIIGH